MMSCKSRLSIAVANALAFPLICQAAPVKVEVYGTASSAIELLDNDSTNKSTTEVSNNHSAFGVKGSVDTGSGVKGVFLYDAFVGLDNSAGGGGGGSLFGGGRDGFVGLDGGFGTVALGFHGRPWKTSTNNMDIFGSTIADYSAVMGTTPGGAYFDGGIANSIIWFSQDMNGIKAHAQWGADEADNSTNDIGIQINHTNGPIYGAVSYDVDGQGTSKDTTALKVAGSYKMGITQLSGIFENISGSDPNSRSAFWIGVAHNMGAVTLKGALAVAGDSDASGSDDGATYLAIGADHKYSDTLKTYVLYSTISNDDGGDYGFVSAPHTSSNGNTAISTATTNRDSSVIAVGFKLDFSFAN